MNIFNEMDLKKRIAAVSLMLAMGLSSPGIASLTADGSENASDGQTVTNDQAPDPAQVAALAGTINQELSKLKPGSSPEDIEAFIVFAVSQSDAPLATVLAALNQVATQPEQTPEIKKALTIVRLALLNRKLNRGTAALLNGGGAGNGNSSFFTGPGGGGGGGGANYPI